MFPLLLGTVGVYGQTTTKGDEGKSAVSLTAQDTFHRATPINQSMSDEQRAAILEQVYTIYAKPYGMIQHPAKTNDGVRSMRVDIKSTKSPVSSCVIYEWPGMRIAEEFDQKNRYMGTWQADSTGKCICLIDSSGKILKTLSAVAK